MFETTLRYNSLNNKHAVEGEYPRYDSLIIDGKMLAYSKKALPQFIQNLNQERSLDYYVEPIISDFRSGDDFRYPDGTIRGWYDSYVNELGDPLKQALFDFDNVNPRHLDEEIIRGISRSVVLYQENFVPNQLKEESGKYEEVDPDEVMPKAVIPWHHRINEKSDLGPNRTILDTTKAEAMLSLKPCIHTTKSFIRDRSHRTSLVELVKDYDVDECFLLIEELGKHNTYESTYKDVIDLVYDISEAGVKPHFYYGDYFSNLLSYFGLGGTTYGVMYGEEYTETTEYTDQGGMLLRYYVDQIKDFLKVPAAVELMKRTDSAMCKCDICQRHFDDWDDTVAHQESDDPLMNHLQKHYIERRWRHARQVEIKSFETIISKLESDRQEYVYPYTNARQISPNKDFDYLPRWINAVKERSELVN
ncbi:hypothetical protein [Natrinema sp. DC36]|uniref:hypothetical protein n=1 Tax=Natrinema sp. DC36 TaxID=2878680 RepID=UPI001CEFF1D6|nr:hypothetical protein [Natrinema sp. DC36]